MMSLNACSEEHLKPEGIQSASWAQALRFTSFATLTPEYSYLHAVVANCAIMMIGAFLSLFVLH
jgi:hypothetical protein